MGGTVELAMFIVIMLVFATIAFGAEVFTAHMVICLVGQAKSTRGDERIWLRSAATVFAAISVAFLYGVWSITWILVETAQQAL